MYKANNFYRIPVPVEAMPVASTNMQEVAKWCGGDVSDCKHASGLLSFFGFGKEENEAVIVPGVETNQIARVGEWVVKDPLYSGYLIMDNEAFYATYVSDRYISYETYLASLKNPVDENTNRRKEVNRKEFRDIVNESFKGSFNA